MSRWPRVPLGEVLQQIRRPVTIKPSQVYSEITVRLWGKGITCRGRVSGSAVHTPRQAVLSGDFVFSKIDARHGAAGIIPPELDGALVSSDFPIFTPRTSRRLDAEFLGWLARSALFIRLCKAASEGTTNRVRLKPSNFLAQHTPLPPLGEQRAIAARLDALAEKTSRLAQHLDASDAAADALTIALHHRLAAGRTVNLSELMEQLEERVAVAPDAAYPQVGIRCFGGGLFSKNPIRGDETRYRFFNRIFENAVVLSQVKGWEGAVAVAPAEFAGAFVSPEYRTFHFRPGRADPTYLDHILRTPWFRSRMQGSTRGVGARRERTRPEKFLGIEIPMPTYVHQAWAGALLERAAALKARQEALREAIAALVPALLERILQEEDAAAPSPAAPRALAAASGRR